MTTNPTLTVVETGRNRPCLSATRPRELLQQRSSLKRYSACMYCVRIDYGYELHQVPPDLPQRADTRKDKGSSGGGW